MDVSLEGSTQQIHAFCQKHHIRRFFLFGSVIRDDFGPKSDIDVLVDFEPGHAPGFEFFSMEAELSRIFGRKVDLQTPNFLSPEIRKKVLLESRLIYEQA